MTGRATSKRVSDPGYVVLASRTGKLIWERVGHFQAGTTQAAEAMARRHANWFSYYLAIPADEWPVKLKEHERL